MLVGLSAGRLYGTIGPDIDVSVLLDSRSDNACQPPDIRTRARCFGELVQYGGLLALSHTWLTNVETVDEIGVALPTRVSVEILPGVRLWSGGSLLPLCHWLVRFDLTRATKMHFCTLRAEFGTPGLLEGNGE